MKQFRVKDEHLYSWVGNLYDGDEYITNDEEIKQLADGWCKTYEELLEQVTEIGEEVNL